MPRLPQEYLMWCGTIHPPEYFERHYDVDQVLFLEDLVPFLTAATATAADLKIHVMCGVNSDSGTACSPPAYEVDTKHSFSPLAIVVIITLQMHGLCITDCVTVQGDSAFSARYQKDSLFHALATCRVTKSDAVMTHRAG